MLEKKYDFEVVFSELSRMIEDQEEYQGYLLDNELLELDEIRTLREIVMDINTEPIVFFTST